MRPAHVPAVNAALAGAAAAETTLYRMPQSLPAAYSLYDGRRLAGARRFVLLAARRVIGTASLQPPRFSGLELTIAIFDPGWRGKGVGTFAVRSLCRIAFGDSSCMRVELGVYPDNERAIACYERCGFRREALLRRFIYHDGAWRDLFWMARVREK